MPSKTLLQIVQKVLNDMSSDPVNDIDDTEESASIASIVEDIFYEFISDERIEKHTRVFRLDASGDTDYPCEMIIPSGIVRIDTIRYNKKDSASDDDIFREVTYLEPADFLKMVLGRTESSTSIDTMNLTEDDNMQIFIFNDRHPTYWTTFNQERIVFDAYVSTLEDTLQSNKTMCIGLGEPVFTRTNNYTINLPTEIMPGFLAEVKAVSTNVLKQMDHVPAVIQARRSRNNHSLISGKVNRKLRSKDYPVGR